MYDEFFADFHKAAIPFLDEKVYGRSIYMTVYLRDIADHRTVARMMDDRFPGIPKTIVLAPVCRPGWLIETECMAVRKADNPEYAPY